jgi:hypothetical protein
VNPLLLVLAFAGLVVSAGWRCVMSAPEPVRRPLAWRIHSADVARLAAEGKHCETRRCRNPVAVVTWRWWRRSEARRALLTEHLVCDQHGQEFADRHHIEIEPTRPSQAATAGPAPGRTSECPDRGPRPRAER